MADVEAQLATFPPLVFAGEARNLKKALAGSPRARPSCCRAAIAPRASPSIRADNIRDFFRVFLQMAVVLTFAGALPVVKVGRIAGQFAKPRSSTTETQDGVELPSYRGDIINDIAFTPEARMPDPQRQLMAYRQSAATLNLLRAFATGGYANLAQRAPLDARLRQGLPAVAALRGTRGPHLRGARLHARLRHRSGKRIRNCARPISTPATRRCCSATSRR